MQPNMEVPMLNAMTAGKNTRKNKNSGGNGSCYFNNTPKETNAFMGGKNKTSNNNKRMPGTILKGGKKNDNNNDNNKNKPMMGGKNNNQKLEVGGNKVYTGPRGGKYIMRNGDKVYLNK